MTRITLSDFKKLKGGNYDGLYHALISCTTANTDGTVQIDDSKIKGVAFQNQWKSWLERNAALVISTSTEQDELWQAEQAAARLEADKAHVKKHADECAARYFQHWVPKGLIDSQQNRSEIFAELEKREKRDGNIPSAALLDVVIPFLSRQGFLQWKQPPVEVPAAPPPPPPPVLLADGWEQLPLGTTPSTRHTVVQLRDLDARDRAERNRKVRESNNEVAQAFAAAATTPALEVEAI